MANSRNNPSDMSFEKDDALLERALADLEKKVSTWRSALLSAQESLQSLSARASAHAAKLAGRADEEPADESAVADSEPSRSAEPETTSHGAACRDEASDPPPADTADKVGETDGDGCETSDEAILAELDEAVACKIRVLRRLHPEQSVASLVAKYRARGGSQDERSDAPGKNVRNWWRKRKR